MIVLHGILPATGHAQPLLATRNLSSLFFRHVRYGILISPGHHRANDRMYCRTFCLSLSDKTHFQAPIAVPCSPP